MFSKDDTLMWGGGKRTGVPQESTDQLTTGDNGQDMTGVDELIMPDPENVPDYVLDVIRPLLITYGAGGSAEAETIRRSIIRYGYEEALPEWFSESNYSGYIPKHDIAHLIYELFYYVVKHGDLEPTSSRPKTKGRNKHIVLKLSTAKNSYYIHLLKGSRETVDGVNVDVFDFPINKQINRYELPPEIRSAFKKQAITVTVDGVDEHDGNIWPSGTTTLNLKADQELVLYHVLEVLPEVAPGMLESFEGTELNLTKQQTQVQGS